MENPAYMIKLSDAPLVNVSSTLIRNAISEGKDISHLIM
jgi:nicotinic acid mononucleotide adenylyltransferase